MKTLLFFMESYSCYGDLSWKRLRKLGHSASKNYLVKLQTLGKFRSLWHGVGSDVHNISALLENVIAPYCWSSEQLGEILLG